MTLKKNQVILKVLINQKTKALVKGNKIHPIQKKMKNHQLKKKINLLITNFLIKIFTQFKKLIQFNPFNKKLIK